MKLPVLRKARYIDEVYKAVITDILTENHRSAHHALVLRHLKEYDVWQNTPSIMEQYNDSDIKEIKPQNALFLKEEERIYTQSSHYVAENNERNKVQRLRKSLVKNESCCQGGAGISEVNKLGCARKDRKNVAHINKSYVCEELDGRSKRVKECKVEMDKGKKAVGTAKGRNQFHRRRIQEKDGPDQPVEKFKGVVKEEVEENEEIYQKTDHCVEIRCVNSVKEEVEILDSDMVVNERILTPFVPDETHHTMKGESHNHAMFRKEVLKAMAKPYDKEEHQNHRETMKDGSYLNCYPGLREILAKYRYQRVKRLIIIRGFLFYLQNAAREGAFPPWEDEECLDILNQET